MPRYEWPYVPCDECGQAVDKRDGTPALYPWSDGPKCPTCGGRIIVLLDYDEDEEE
jgi:DNA-directed RNA polymerase subunit RPC12/RpoP